MGEPGQVVSQTGARCHLPEVRRLNRDRFQITLVAGNHREQLPSQGRCDLLSADYTARTELVQNELAFGLVHPQSTEQLYEPPRASNRRNGLFENVKQMI